jgi:hypothetical protein
LSESEKKGSEKYFESANSLELFSCIANDNETRFDQIMSTLSKQLKYDENLIPAIYTFYSKRGLAEKAFIFLSSAIDYFKEEGITPAIDLKELRERLKDEKLYERILETLNHLRNLSPEEIPLVLPKFHNGRTELNIFILEEILHGLRTLSKKIRAVESIDTENKYNDILLASLNLRLTLWGWSIIDQSRGGLSPTLIDAGEIDLSIKATNDLTLIEAFILTGQNYTKVREHLLKCKNYLATVNCYYIVIYYKGKKANFNSTWDSYKEDVEKIDFPIEMALNKKEGITEITTMFNQIDNMKVAATKHSETNTLYHVMVDLSDPNPILPLVKVKKKSAKKTIKAAKKPLKKVANQVKKNIKPSTTKKSLAPKKKK